ncbi:MAG: hypothetical protein H7177_10110 [Rhizobacter sp.]|nr:hypothetical protein [Bacteriovorax sp.]
MKKFINTKLFVAIIFFCAGFLVNHLLVKFVHNPGRGIGFSMNNQNSQNSGERVPVNPDDFDQAKMIETIQRMQNETMDGFDSLEKDLKDAGNSGGAGVLKEHEDDKFVYYEIPLKGHDGTNHKLNVEIKNGLVRVSEDSKDQGGNSMTESSSERMFTLDPRRVDADKAEVLNGNDKIVIKIPKKH